jgi:hypothetical protein
LTWGEVIFTIRLLQKLERKVKNKITLFNGLQFYIIVASTGLCGTWPSLQISFIQVCLLPIFSSFSVPVLYILFYTNVSSQSWPSFCTLPSDLVNSNLIVKLSPLILTTFSSQWIDYYDLFRI